MILARFPVVSVTEVGANVHVLRFQAPPLARSIRPGQFLNIKAEEGLDPLLRRPFSVYRCEGDEVELIFNVIGKGTAVLHRKRPGELLDVLGPLGVPFTTSGAFDTAMLIAGGLGVAPMPMAAAALQKSGKRVITMLGARTKSQLVTAHLGEVRTATDDGSEGHHGNAVELARAVLAGGGFGKVMLYACGPTPMLRGVQALALEQDLPCEVSLEGPMACGFGICQGCPVELAGEPGTYALMCKDGPTFDVRTVRF
jgi:dihydroorotate dehydrogenase electron transfer subunit